ncbi:hypothetical protein [Desulfonatronum parangueonense]
MTEALTPILKWQYEQLLKEMLLLQSHLTDQDCPCETESEMCVRKHLLIIEAYAQETIPLEKDEEFQTKLQQLAIEAKNKRNVEERKLRGEDQGLAEEDSDWVRGWRKEFEFRSLAEPQI